MIRFKKIFTKDYELKRVQDNVDEALRFIESENPILDGVFIQANIGTVDTTINHTLTRKLNGWLIVDRDANAVIWQSTTANNMPEKQIILKSTAAVNVKIYFF